ncbi:hypothetical protein Tco_0951170 [Tanacetum coccineum]|uniref:Tf2-1-like SH3-like domain-containing protein n=1 Tax=Tanacetum coccineum TaxID=301880 RepID=A0ABQ5DTC9_9ASTR
MNVNYHGMQITMKKKTSLEYATSTIIGREGIKGMSNTRRVHSYSKYFTSSTSKSPSTIRKGVVRFGRKEKLAPWYVGPFKIVERVGPVTYRLRLPQELGGIHDTFHVSNLKKCLVDASLQVPLEEIEIHDKLHFVEEPVKIIDREVKKLKQRRITLVKVSWSSKRGAEFTWE